MFYGEDAGSHPEYHKSNSNQSFPTPSVTNTLVTTHTDLVTPSSFLISSYMVQSVFSGSKFISKGSVSLYSQIHIKVGWFFPDF